MAKFIFFILSIIGLATAVPRGHLFNRDSTALEPDKDPFYKAPAGFESAAPGTILKSRPVPNAISLNNVTPIRPKAAWQLQYRTQNSVGEPEANVVTVLVPYRANKNNLFGQIFFSDAAYNGCNPSISLQEGDRQDNTFTQLQTVIIIAALNQGWYVSVADDGGPQASFPSGLQAAYATLDSIRAVKRSGMITGISSNPITTLNGYSGSGLSAAWASELHSTYAPELEIAGVALGGLVPNISAMIETVNSAEHASFGPPTLLGLSHDYANLSQWLDENLTPSLAQEFRLAEKQCITANNMYTGKDFGQYFKGGMSALSHPIPASVFSTAGIMGQRATPKSPWYLYHSVGDQMSPVAFTDALAQKYCKNGADIEYERNVNNVDHSSESFSGFPGAFQWLKDRQAGKPITPGCRTSAVSQDSTNAGSSGILGQSALLAFLALLGIPINILED